MADARKMIEAMLPPGQKSFTTAELANIFGIREGRFEEWRSLKSGGPSFVKLGRFVRYPRPAVIEWAISDATLMAS